MEEPSSSPAERDRGSFYTCIASDSLLTSDGSIINAQQSTKSEIAELLIGNSGDCASFATPPPSNEDSDAPTPIDVWQCQQSPEASMVALQSCSIWFLFTDVVHHSSDGIIFDSRISSLGVENYPCVFVLFGSSSNGPPSSTPWDTCIVTYSRATDALILFHDIGTDQVYVLDCKGCFAKLAEGRPTVETPEWEDCKWFQLRRFRYEKLLDIDLPGPHPIPFGNQLTVYNNTIYTNAQYRVLRATTDVGEKVNIERLQEIIHKAAEKHTFKPQYTKSSHPAYKIERVDIEGKAGHAVHMILMNLDHQSMGIDVPESRMDEYRQDLRASNKANRLAFQEAFVKKQEEAAAAAEKQKARESFLLPVPDHEETFFPGFVRAPMTDRKNSEIRGTCMFCNEEDVILVFLLHHIELIGHGNLEVTGLPLVFDNMLVCDACATHFPNNPQVEQEVVAVLPLVSVIDNEKVWTEAFEAVIEGFEVAKGDVLLLVWKWLSTQLEYEVGELKPVAYKEALEWVLKDLGKWENTTRNRRYDTKSICY